MKLDEVGVTEKVKDFIARNGVIKTNRDGRATSLTWVNNRKKLSGIKPEQKFYGHITYINGRKISKTATPEQLMAYLKQTKEGDIQETYPTRFCINWCRLLS